MPKVWTWVTHCPGAWPLLRDVEILPLSAAGSSGKPRPAQQKASASWLPSNTHFDLREIPKNGLPASGAKAPHTSIPFPTALCLVLGCARGQDPASSKTWSGLEGMHARPEERSF